MEEKKLLDEIESLREKNKSLEQEIEQLRKSDEELKHERALMDALMNNIPDSIYFKDRQCRLTRISQKMSNDLFNDGIKEVLGKTDIDLFGREFGIKTLGEDQRLMESGQPIVGLMESRHLDSGFDVWTLTDKVPIKNENGEIIGLVGITRDVSDIVRAEQERERERLLLRTLIDNIPDYIYIKDNQGRFRIANKSVVNQFGLSSEAELIGKSDFDFFQKELAQRYFLDEQQIMKTEMGIYNYEGPTIDNSKENKNRWVSTTKVPFRDSEHKVIGTLGIGRDVTENKEIEEKLLKVLEELKELNKTKDKFFSIIAHDMRSPFVGLMGYSEILATEYETLTEDEKITFIKSIDELSHNAYNLLENLLEWSRIQTGRIRYEPSMLNLYSELKSTVFLLTETAKNKNVTVECKIEDGTKVFADKNMLQTIVRNLVSNAIKFTPTAGTITISSNEVNERLEISVQDTGVGIKPENIKNLFKIDKSITTKGTNNEEGSGLGLFLCKEMVQMHGGEISIESEVGKGTKFSFTLGKNELAV